VSGNRERKVECYGDSGGNPTVVAKKRAKCQVKVEFRGCRECVGKNLLESVLLVLERAAYKSGLPPYRNLGSDALFSCDICLYIPVDSTLLQSSVAIKRKLSSSSTLQIPTE
jgi:hypothetical protein